MLFRKKSSAKHKLVVIGDSLSQGFKNGGIYRTDLNFPSILVRCFDPDPEFQQPSFTAQAGIPINLEVLVRGLHDEFGESFEWNEYLPAARHLLKTLRRIKKYWEGGFRDLCIDRENPYHNQAIWGMSVSDAWIVTEQKCREYMATHKPRFTVFSVLPDDAMYTTARLVLNPPLDETFEKNSMIENATLLQDDGGIENLIVCLGHNNIVQSVTEMKLVWSETEDLHRFPSDRFCTIYRPEHFELKYRALAERVSKIGAERVVVPTLPYVTIPPAIRGVNEDKSRQHEGYFDYYTRFWIWDSDFDPDKHPHLTRDDARVLDQTVDAYNEIIRTVAAEYGWIVAPVGRHVSAIAQRRLGGEVKHKFPDGFVKALKNNPDTSHMVLGENDLLLSTNYIRLHPETGKINKGGIFSLDGLHPTTIGYGLMAGVYFRAMREAGVKFQKPIDWDFVVANDTLVTNPPRLLIELRSLLKFLSLGRNEKFLKLGKGVLEQLMHSFDSARSIEKAKTQN